ncbi:SAG-related sequence SRS53F [Besnoitia besnoiti]|uniref:SAG-related sequence SRS53F n=1 Tax=Besnoitia besnoiti TaxID=94643 RepID=A0A2A9M6S9_BESBE|nr:SAG-related sequence SRS53F [Besnoitia besnoiti]PFH33705.1 SAG-related sequence SRS53F [Besnoitia besnoiti]
MAALKNASLLRWKVFAFPVAVTALMACTVNGVQTTQVQVATPDLGTCDAAEKSVAITVDAGKKKAQFVCDKAVPHVWPKKDENDVLLYFRGRDLKETSGLEDLFGVDSKLTVQKITKANEASPVTATLSIGALPTMQQIIYFACGATEYKNIQQPGEATVDISGGRSDRAPGAVEEEATPGRRDRRDMPVAVAGRESSAFSSGTKAASPENREVKAMQASAGNPSQSNKDICLVTVTVPADPSAPTCTLAKKSMEVDITSEAKSTTFSCDSTIPSLSPETSSGNIFDESCAKPVKLAEALPTAKLEPAGSGYTFSVVELPSAPTTLCYKCSTSPEKERGGADESCTVKIKVAAGLSSLAGLTHLQPVLAVGSLLVIGSVVFF